MRRNLVSIVCANRVRVWSRGEEERRGWVGWRRDSMISRSRESLGVLEV